MDETAILKKYGRRSRESTIIKRLLNNGIKLYDWQKSGYTKFEFGCQDYFLFCNTVYIMASAKDDYGYTELESPYSNIMLRGLFSPFENLHYGIKDKYYEVYVRRDDVVMQKGRNKINKTKEPFTIDTEGGIAGFDPEYLIDFIDYFETEKFFVRKDGFHGQFMSLITPAYFENNDKIGLLLPVHT